ncbi:hypothetical protein CPB84DRAFT_767569 [Gymnopilus junonius]|uniref:Uncharacterized protein n=1 Tax=Gymnopilus junonius TaxID=109634 RepID=A0A9P5NQY4_GYMJU|nr:hypothetical protein CPB84DRAFT_767569 [Gymnopilus junonius]
MSLSILKRYPDTPALPFDVLLAIIDEVACTDDIYTLRSCSLLHHDLLPHCQKYLFETFDMRNGSPETEQYFFKFCTLLTKSPHLARYVHFLYMLYLNLAHVPIDESLPNQPSTVYFLRSLTNVTAFGLHFTKMRWGNLGIGFQNEIRRIITQPCCEELMLAGLDYIPRSVINNCRFVKALSMTACSLECWNPERAVAATENGTVTTIPESNWVHLKNAEFFNSEYLFESLYPCSSTLPIHLDFSNLKHLKVTLSPDTMEVVWKFIHFMSPTLVTLAINQTYRFEVLAEGISEMTRYNGGCLTFEGSYQTLSPLSHLLRFSFSIILYDLDDHSEREHLFELCTLLRTCPPSIRQICIKLDLYGCNTKDVDRFFFPPSSDDEEYEDDDGRPFLMGLDQTLSDQLLFPSLDFVEIGIVLEDDYESDSDESIEEYSYEELLPLPLDEIRESARNMMQLTEQSLEDRVGLFVDVWVRERIASD